MATKPSSPQRRLPLLSLAIVSGALILIAHIITLRIVPRIGNELITLFADWPIEFSMPKSELRDMALHASMFTLFTLCYRLSWRGSGPGIRLATIMVCSGWGVICETLQLGIQRRDFSFIDMGVNALTPIIIVGLIRLFERR